MTLPKPTRYLMPCRWIDLWNLYASVNLSPSISLHFYSEIMKDAWLERPIRVLYINPLRGLEYWGLVEQLGSTTVRNVANYLVCRSLPKFPYVFIVSNYQFLVSSKGSKWTGQLPVFGELKGQQMNGAVFLPLSPPPSFLFPCNSPTRTVGHLTGEVSRSHTDTPHSWMRIVLVIHFSLSILIIITILFFVNAIPRSSMLPYVLRAPFSPGFFFPPSKLQQSCILLVSLSARLALNCSCN